MKFRVQPYILAALQSLADKYAEDRVTKVSDLAQLILTEFGVYLDETELDELVGLGKRAGLMRVIDDPLTTARVKYFFGKGKCSKILAKNASTLRFGSEEDKRDLKVLENYFEAGDEWLEEALGSIRSLSSDEPNAQQSVFAPASDRIVSRSDNSDDYDEAIQSLEKIIFDVGSHNEFANEFPDEKEAVVADLKAGRELLSADAFWLKSVWETVIKALRYLVNKFGDAAIGAAASELLQLLLTLLGLG